MQIAEGSLEPEILRIGRDIARRSAGESPTMFDRRWWSNTLLDWAMKDEAFKVRLFRFVDVLPAVHDDAHLAALVDEYFGDLSSIGGTLQWGVRALSATKVGARLGAKSIRQQVLQMATMFIAGTTPAEAESTLLAMWKDGRAFSVDLLGEACVSEAEADRYRDRCLEALARLAALISQWPSAPRLEQDHLGIVPRINLSIKLSALYSQLDPIDPEGSYRGVAARLRPLIDRASTIPASITFDMEQAELKDLILSVFMRLFSEEPYRRFPHASIAVQAYLKESPDDIERLLEWGRTRRAPIGIRLVKGAYWDSDVIRYEQRGWPVPVFQSKAETDANYERLTRRLLEAVGWVRPAFGTHNLRSLAHAEAAASAMKVDPRAYEYQMIYGMAEPFQRAVVALNRRMRVYTPVGELIPGMAYLVRRLLENTSNESFLRKEHAGHKPLEQLLAPPSLGPRADAEAVSGTDARFRNEPHTDFSQAAAREAMAAALAGLTQQFGRSFAPRLGRGVLAGPESAVYNPSHPEQLLARVVTASMPDVAQAVEAAREAWNEWRTVPVDVRAACLRKAAQLMRARRFDLAAWEIVETGKPWREADADVAEAIDFCEFYAREMERVGVPRRLGHEPGELNELSYDPRGLTVVIAPWNFPLAIPTGMVSAALVTGNVVLFKPSERASVMGILLAELLYEAGVPPAVLHVLPGGPEVGRRLAEHPAVDVIAFTGSKSVGLELISRSAQVAADQRSIKRVIAEMGGKNAIIVDDSADLDEAVLGVLASFTGYQGQKCSACSRVIVHDAMYEAFASRLKEAVLSMRIGPAEEPGTMMGPMIDRRALEKVKEYIEIGRKEGRLIVERIVDHPGHFVGPAVFGDMQPSHRLTQEEVFGPVLALMKARSFEEALGVANDSCYALTGGLYSRSPRHIALARQSFDVGNLYINRPITGALVGRQPFGGHRLSGVGAKAGGEDYLLQFLVPRVVSENTVRRGFAPSEF